jgi:hypothetical protein
MRVIHYRAGQNMPLRTMNVPADQYAAVCKCLQLTGCYMVTVR